MHLLGECEVCIGKYVSLCEEIVTLNYMWAKCYRKCSYFCLMLLTFNFIFMTANEVILAWSAGDNLALFLLPFHRRMRNLCKESFLFVCFVFTSLRKLSVNPTRCYVSAYLRKINKQYSISVSATHFSLWSNSFNYLISIKHTVLKCYRIRNQVVLK